MDKYALTKFVIFNFNISFSLGLWYFMSQIFAMDVPHYSRACTHTYTHTACIQKYPAWCMAKIISALYCLSPVSTWVHCVTITAIFWQNAYNKSYENRFHNIYSICSVYECITNRTYTSKCFVLIFKYVECSHTRIQFPFSGGQKAQRNVLHCYYIFQSSFVFTL